MKKIVLAVVMVLLCASLGFAESADSQLWLWQIVEGDLNENVSASLDASQIWEKDMGELSYYHTDLGFKFKTPLEDWLSLGINYRQVYTLGSDGDWAQEKRPHLNFSTKFPTFHGLAFSNRLRVEYRDTVAYNNWRFRDYVKVVLPYKWTSWSIQPYIGDEIFYDCRSSTLNMNRFYVGIKTGEIIAKIKADVAYLWQANKSNGNWNDTHLLVIKTTISF